MLPLFIDWNPDPEIINLFGFSVRYYGLMFALAFFAGFKVLSYIFKKEGKPVEQADELLMYAIIATIVGARMGHYFFYEYPLLLKNPLVFFVDMVTPPFAGLASHGAAIGLFSAFYLYHKKHPEMSYLYVTDRVVLTVTLGGFFIRMGNLMNSEIVGKPTELPWGFRFFKDTEHILASGGQILPRHPSQLYEAITCLILFVVLYRIWNKYKTNLKAGYTTGVFLIWIFGLRFFYEFLKENQVAFEDRMVLNMGQILSIPCVLAGVYLLIRKQKA